MAPTKTPEEAIVTEFGLNYGETISFGSNDAFRTTLPWRAWDSADRLKRHVSKDQIPELISILASLKHEPYGRVMCAIIQDTLIGWPDDPDDWELFKEIAEKIIGYLRTDPGPRPPHNQ